MADATHKGRKCTLTPPPGTAAPGDAPLWKGGRGSQESCAACHPAGKAETHEKAEGRGEPVLKSLVPGLAEEGKNGRQLLKFSSALLSQGSLCAGRNYMGAPPFGCKHAHRTCVCRWLGAEREAGCRPPRTSPAMERHPAPGENAIEYP